MTPYLKLIQTDLDKKQYGDCYRTAVASILDVPPDIVPHVFADPKGLDVATAKMRAWLATWGRRMFTFHIHAETLDEVLGDMQRLNPDEFYILLGCTADGVGHAVVGRGGQIVHDPNPERPGVPEPLIDGLCWVVQVIATAGVSAPPSR